MEQDVAVAMRGISKRFGNVVANDDITFDARFGEVHALIGENGAGKSTLMSILAGLYRPDAGTIAVGGLRKQLKSPRDAIESGIGMVYQHFMLVDTLTVAENVLLGLPAQGFILNAASTERQLAELAARYGLEVEPDASVWQLSVGEQQRVEILRLLYRGARILVFDEPTAVLTPQEADGLIATLRRMAANGYCIVFISHKLDEVLAVADRITVLRRGKTVATVDAAGADRHALARMMVERPLAAPLAPPADRVLGGPVLELDGLRADSDRGAHALNEVSLTVAAGETLGVAGVAGNGQRELAEVITGLRRSTGGRVRVGGSDLTGATPAGVAAAGVAHIPEDRLATGLAASLPVEDNAILRDYARKPLSRGPFLVSRAIATFADRLIGQYDVKTPTRTTRVGALSGGNQQKLLIARELSGEPAVIVAVHPTRGVDIGATETIHGLLAEQRQRGAATLLISEDLDELRALSDRITVLYRGRLVDTLPVAEASIERLGGLMAGVLDPTEVERGPAFIAPTPARSTEGEIPLAYG